MNTKALQEFVTYCDTHIKGDEKGEAQIFLDRFFTALGYKDGLKGAGADLEFRVRGEKSTSFADLLWPKKVLIEMKKAEEDLSRHLQQVSSYYLKLAGLRPQYIILCNFNEFWIYDFNKDVYEPADIVGLHELPEKSRSISFLFPIPQTPIFRTNREAVTEKAAKSLDALMNSLKKRGISKEISVRYSLQCILAMFAQSVKLLPDMIFSDVIKECMDSKQGEYQDSCPQSYDLIGTLFREMNSKGITEGGRFRNVDYFNGGLFQEINPVELTYKEVEYLESASNNNWSKVNPAIFGSFFEGGLDVEERHMHGAHYTYEIDIKKIVDPVIVQPWKKKIEKAAQKDNPLDEYYKLIGDLRNFKVLDPACGSGNFLFVAYREMKMLEKELLALIRENSTTKESSKTLQKFLAENKYVSTKQFYGIDVKPFAVEVAKMTLMVAKELWVTQNGEAFDNEAALPLENLDENIRCMDALVQEDGSSTVWPEVDVIIGNPPFQSKNKMQKEFGVEYLNKIRTAYPEVPGRADFCVYWFHRAHKHLKPNGRAGLVGTNTITQNYSREGSLDYIVKNGGVIYNAIESQKWSGEAAVHVSIACWKNGKFNGQRYLFTQEKNELAVHSVELINSSLSLEVDVTEAQRIRANVKPKKLFQGQTHGHEGFLIESNEAKSILKKNSEYSEVLKPFLIGDELVASINSQPKRFVIDFTFKNQIEASQYKVLFDKLKSTVLPTIQEKAHMEEKGLTKSNGRIAWLNTWWLLWRRREDLLKKQDSLRRYIACARVTQRPIFELFDTDIRPNDKVMAFCFDDFYSFGIIQSNWHWQWFLANCTTLGETPNYNSASIWDTFPWPQAPSEAKIRKVAEAAQILHQQRTKTLRDYKMTLRDLYRTLEQPGKNPIKDLHQKLDQAVMEAYGFDPKGDILTQLLALNHQVAEKEEKGEKVTAPGLPGYYPDPKSLITDDCVRFEG